MELEVNLGIKLLRNTFINTLIFADKQRKLRSITINNVQTLLDIRRLQYKIYHLLQLKCKGRADQVQNCCQ